MDEASEYVAFMKIFTIHPTSSSPNLPLQGLTFAIKDIFDVEGHVAAFGNPDWAKTHPAATSTAPAVKTILDAGATSVGITIMDEMAYSINGENIHYGTPKNPCAPDRVPGGSSSGSAVAVAASLVDFSLGTDTGGSVRVPASYCGIFGFRPSHDAVSTAGVIPLAQSFDTVGWFARDPEILSRVGRVLLNLPNTKPAPPGQVIVPEDCFQLTSVPKDRMIQPLLRSIENLFGGHIVKKIKLGGYIENTVPSLKHFVSTEMTGEEHNIPYLAALSTSMRTLQRFEFKKNHGEWVTSVKPSFGPGISQRVREALEETDDKIEACLSVKVELRSALSQLLQDCDVLVIPSVPGPPPKLQTEPAALENFRARAFSLLSIAGVSGFCQVSIPMGFYDNLPVAISLLARHGSDGFLLGLVETLYDAMRA